MSIKKPVIPRVVKNEAIVVLLKIHLDMVGDASEPGDEPDRSVAVFTDAIGALRDSNTLLTQLARITSDLRFALTERRAGNIVRSEDAYVDDADNALALLLNQEKLKNYVVTSHDDKQPTIPMTPITPDMFAVAAQNWSVVYNNGPTTGVKFFVGDQMLVVDLPTEKAASMATMILQAIARSGK